MSSGSSADSLSVEQVSQAGALAANLRSRLGGVLVGMDRVIDQLLIALIAGGHVLLEGVPGVAKTSLSKLFARILGVDYSRIQFTPDLLPTDVTGTSIFDRRTNDFVVRKGPIFTQVLLADEINRAPAKTQSALLEAMQEYQVTLDGQTLPLPQPFFVLATQNPIEQEGVYRLPEAQLDRFLLKVNISYPGHDEEVRMLQMHSGELPVIEPLTNAETLFQLRGMVNRIHAATELHEYIVQLAESTRRHPDLVLGASPRASMNLLRAAKTRALLLGRNYLTHEDIQSLAFPVWAHRLILRPESELEGQTIDLVIEDVIRSVPVSTARRTGT